MFKNFKLKIENWFIGKTRFIVALLFLCLFAIPHSHLYSQSEDKLRNKIEDHNTTIKKLEEEIKSYERQVQAASAEAKTLQSAIEQLELNQKKLRTEIKKTETNIAKSNLILQELGGAILTTEEKITVNTEAVSATLNDMRQSEEQSLIEHILNNQSISDVLDNYESIHQFQQKIRGKSQELALHKEDLTVQKTATEKEKNKLLSFKLELNDQHKILDNSKKEQNNLLVVTRNQEAGYKKLLATKRAEKERFENELFEFESQLKRIIDPNSFPSSGKDILHWPLDNIFVTQPFGKTVDSHRFYTSGTHNGVDFRASRGTRVLAALSGVVQGIGNTDEQRGCYSYGKWVLLKHPNGLSTLYAHLDLIRVSSGQSVETGEIIGYSGQTGYATGPHLHFTLYASQGIEIQRYSSSINCKNVSIPISDKSAYLDPMQYF